MHVGTPSCGIPDSVEGAEEQLTANRGRDGGYTGTSGALPCSESLVLRMDINRPILDDPQAWDVFHENIKVEKWEGTVKRVDLVIRFDLEDEPDEEVLSVSSS